MAQGTPGSKQTGALCPCTHSDYSNCLPSPREFRASWKIRNIKGGAEAQLSIHTLPAASPARRGGDKHIHEGILPAQPLAPGTLGSHQHTNDPERLVKDRPRRQLTLSCHTQSGLQESHGSCSLLWLCAKAQWAAHAPLPGPAAFLGSKPADALCPSSSAHTAENRAMEGRASAFLQREAVSD